VQFASLSKVSHAAAAVPILAVQYALLLEAPKEYASLLEVPKEPPLMKRSVAA
jgi:hypothetical protein